MPFAEEHIGRAQLLVDLLKKFRPGHLLTGIEIGVFYGDFISCLLDAEPRISVIYGIDPYEINSGYKRFRSQGKWDRVYDIAMENLEKYGDRFILIRSKSEYESTLEQLPPLVDFVEIDGLHTYEQVSLEIKLYEPRVRSGGILCGHDYYGPFRRPVQRAVRDYARANKRVVHASSEPLGMWWWRVP